MCIYRDIILFGSITMVCGIDNILWNILHIQPECGENSSYIVSLIEHCYAFE